MPCEYEENYRDYIREIYKEIIDGLLDKVLKQLPEGMKHCTIKYLECPEGHGRLWATNWVSDDCQTCEINRLREYEFMYKSVSK